MPRGSRPDAKYILSLKKHRTDLWAQAHAEWSRVDTYYNRTFPLWEDGDDSRPVYHPSKPTSLIDHAVDQFLSYTPIPHKFTSGRGEAKKEDADRIEPAMSALFRKAALMEPVLTWKQVSKHLLLYGYAVVEGPVVVMRDKPVEPVRKKGETDHELELRIMDYREDRKAWLPIRIRSPHPARVLLDPLEKMPEEAIKVVKRYAKDLAELTRRKRLRGDKVWQERDNPFELIPTMEYWTKEWHALFAEDDLLYVERNTWRIMIFKHAFAGSGQEPTDQEQVNPMYLAVSQLTPVMDSLKLQAQAASGRHNALIEATFVMRETTEESSEVAADIAKGGIRQATRKGDVWYAETPNLPAWIFQSEAEIDRDIEEGTYARTLSGLREVGVSTVGQQAILTAAGSRQFADMVEQQQQLASLVASDVLRIVKLVDEPITIGEYTLDPGDIHDYEMGVTFELLDPILQLQQQQQGMEAVERGLLSRETYWNTVAKLEDATGEHKRILVEKMEKSPEVEMLLMMAAAEEAGLFDAIDQFRQRRQAMQQGQLASPDQTILGPDGQPLRRTLGTGVVEDQVNAPQGAMESLRQALLGRSGLVPTIPPGNGQIRIPPGGI